MPKTPTMQHCFYCGAELGVSSYHYRRDTCGARECDDASREHDGMDRQEAHEQLDRDMGW